MTKFILIILILFCPVSLSIKNNKEYTIPPSEGKIIIDSKMNIEEALSNKNIPASIKKNLRIINVEYFSFDNKLHRGQIVIHKDLVNDIKEIFEKIKTNMFPIKKAVPIARYNWSDSASMNDNNTSAFNYRKIAGTRLLSSHARGLAIDINPKNNPQIKHGKINPHGSIYNLKLKGTISKNSFIVKAFKQRGWIWGGDWKSTKDYQHFEKQPK